MKSFRGNGWTVSENKGKVAVVVHDIRATNSFHNFFDMGKLEEFLKKNKELPLLELLEEARKYHEFTCVGRGWIAESSGPKFRIVKSKSREELFSTTIENVEKIEELKRIVLTKCMSLKGTVVKACVKAIS